MTTFALVQNGKVVQVIVAAPAHIETLANKADWIETFKDGGKRKNFAGPGMIYDADLDAFYVPQPYPSWILNSETCIWHAPINPPDDGLSYIWDEPLGEWIAADAQP